MIEPFLCDGKLCFLSHKKHYIERKVAFREEIFTQ